MLVELANNLYMSSYIIKVSVLCHVQNDWHKFLIHSSLDLAFF